MVIIDQRSILLSNSSDIVVETLTHAGLGDECGHIFSKFTNSNY